MGKMQLYGPFILFLGLVVQVRGFQRITLDDDAQALCKKYKMMCKTDKICAVQHFEWPNNITIPVCIPLSFVPVRNMICQLPPDTGRCHARYTRWYYNIHAQECSHFQYGGCEGNGNNFMSRKDCEQTCIATPSIRLYEGGGSSALVQPSIITAPIYEPPKIRKYEALNSVMEPADNYDRYEIIRHRPNRNRADEATTRTRRRLDKEREKERKRRERRKEKKRLRKLQKKEQRKLRCKKRRERGKKCKKDKKDRKSRKNKKKKKTDNTEEENDISSDKSNAVTKDTNQVVEETKNIISNEIAEAAEGEKLEKETKREKRRRKRKLKEKRRLEKDRNRRNLSSRHQQRYSELVRKPESYSSKLFSILDQGNQYKKQKNSLLHTLS